MEGSSTTLMIGAKLLYVKAVFTWWGRMVTGVITAVSV